MAETKRRKKAARNRNQVLRAGEIATLAARCRGGESERVFRVPSKTVEGKTYLVRTHGSEDLARWSCDCHTKMLKSGEFLPLRLRSECCHIRAAAHVAAGLPIPVAQP